MLYSNIIFQLISINKHYLGYFCYDEVNANLEGITVKDLIQKQLTIIKSDFLEKSFSINVITQYYNQPSIMDNDIIYDIVIDNKEHKIYFIGTNYDYNSIFNDINKDMWKGDIYDKNELEYILPTYDFCYSVHIPYYDDLDEDHENYELRNIFDIKDVKEYEEDDENDNEDEEDKINKKK